MGQIVETLRQLIQVVVQALGYFGVGLMMFAETVFPPIPSELVMPFSGSLVSEGMLSLSGVLLAGVAGASLGALALYDAGRAVSEDDVRKLLRRYGRYVLLEEDDLDRSMRWFERRGRAAVFLGRLVPGIRSVISLPAGLRSMPLGTFLILTVAGFSLWVGVLTYAGVLLGEHWDEVLRFLSCYEAVMWLAIGGLIGVFVYRRLRTDRGT